jgi:hypothetical protein
MVIDGFNWGYFFVQLINLTLPIAWFILAVVALFMLRRRELPDTALAVWAAIIVIIPILGALAFWIVSPGRRTPGGSRPE